MRLILEEQQQYLQFFINNVTYHHMNTDGDFIYQTVNCSDKCFIYIRQSIVLKNVLSTLFLMFHITFDVIITTLSVQF